jgi:ankyrin repeat protein
MPKASNVMARLHDAWNVGDKRAFEAALAASEQQPGPSEKDENGRTALWLAASIGSVKAIELLLRSGGVIESRCPRTGYTPLHAAVFWEHLDASHFLLEGGADPNQPDAHGQTPLMLACVGGSLEIAKSLIDFHAIVDLQDEHGMTALMMGSARRRTAIVRILFSEHAAVNVQDKRGSTALMLAANIEIAGLLLEHGADTSLRDRAGKTVHDRMASRPEMTALLIRSARE